MSDPETGPTTEAPTFSTEPAPEAQPAETVARSDYVIQLRSHLLPWIAFALVLVAALGGFIVLWGEVRNWTADPGSWARLLTRTWLLIGTAVFVLASLYYLLLLVRREVPEHTYVVTGPEETAGAAPEPTPTDSNPPQA